MFRSRKHSFTLFVVTAFFSASVGVPTPPDSEVVACPNNTFCLPRKDCQSTDVVYDARNSNRTVNYRRFACGVLEPSDGHVCCAKSTAGFQPTAQAWIPNMRPPASKVNPWSGFSLKQSGADGKRLENSSVLKSLTNESIVSVDGNSLTGFKAIILPGRSISETNLRSVQQNSERWPCGEPVNPAALNSTFTFTTEETPVNQGDYPWQVALLTTGMQYICGGSLVGSRTVVTLASCLLNATEDKLLVRIGDVDLSSNRETLPAYDVPVINITLHPAYNPAVRRFDIAILELQHRVSSLQHARAACLPLLGPDDNPQSLNPQFPQSSGQANRSHQIIVPDLKNCYLASWGVVAGEQGAEENFSYVLRGGPSYVLDRNICQIILSNNLTEDQRCVAGYGGTAICRGGGGSAVVCRSGDRFVLEGILAPITVCNRNTPLSYIKISEYLSFIVGYLNLQSMRIEEDAVEIPTKQNNPVAASSSDKITDRPPIEQTDSSSFISNSSQDPINIFNNSTVDRTLGFPLNDDGRGGILIQSQSSGSGSLPMPFIEKEVLTSSAVNRIVDDQGGRESGISGFSQQTTHDPDDLVPDDDRGRPLIQSSSNSGNGIVKLQDVESPGKFVESSNSNSARTINNHQEDFDDISKSSFIMTPDVTQHIVNVPATEQLNLTPQGISNNRLHGSSLIFGDSSSRPFSVNRPLIKIPDRQFPEGPRQFFGSLAPDSQRRPSPFYTDDRTGFKTWQPAHFQYPHDPYRDQQLYEVTNFPFHRREPNLVWEPHHGLEPFPQTNSFDNRFRPNAGIQNVPNFHPGFIADRPYRKPHQEQFTPSFIPEPFPNLPPRAENVIEQKLPSMPTVSAQDTSATSAPTPQTFQQSSIESSSDNSKIRNSVENLGIIYQYLSKYQ